LVANHSFSQGFEGYLNVPVYFGSLGFPAPPGLALVPDAGAGFITFLPHGKVTGRVTLAIGLLALAQDLTFDYTSQYSLSWDTTRDPAVCSGAVTLNAPGEAPFHFQLLVYQDGQRIEMIHTDAGLIVGVTGFPVLTSGCSNRVLNGKYFENMKGWGLAPPSGPLSFPPEQLLAGYFPFAASGAWEFQPNVPPSATEFPGRPAGSGSIVAWDLASLNGIIASRSMTGWYKVNHDCTGMLVVRDTAGGYPDFHLEIVVVENGKAVDLVNVDTVPGPFPGMSLPAYVLGTTLSRIGEGND
jgi:hypothetical protein